MTEEEKRNYVKTIIKLYIDDLDDRLLYYTDEDMSDEEVEEIADLIYRANITVSWDD